MTEIIVRLVRSKLHKCSSMKDSRTAVGPSLEEVS